MVSSPRGASDDVSFVQWWRGWSRSRFNAPRERCDKTNLRKHLPSLSISSTRHRYAGVDNWTGFQSYCTAYGEIIQNGIDRDMVSHPVNATYVYWRCDSFCDWLQGMFHVTIKVWTAHNNKSLIESESCETRFRFTLFTDSVHYHSRRAVASPCLVFSARFSRISNGCKCYCLPFPADTLFLRLVGFVCV